jgi:hypothetical protein
MKDITPEDLIALREEESILDTILQIGKIREYFPEKADAALEAIKGIHSILWED